MTVGAGVFWGGREASAWFEGVRPAEVGEGRAFGPPHEAQQAITHKTADNNWIFLAIINISP